MAKILCEERVLEYSKEFKVMVVKLTDGLSVKAIDIADILNLHPMMVYRWRQEFREGKLISNPSRRVNMSLDHREPKPLSKKQLNENELLKKENMRLKKENDLLKKWQQYLAEVRQNDSDS
jgi:transposase